MSKVTTVKTEAGFSISIDINNTEPGNMDGYSRNINLQVVSTSREEAKESMRDVIGFTTSQLQSLLNDINEI